MSISFAYVKQAGGFAEGMGAPRREKKQLIYEIIDQVATSLKPGNSKSSH
jgi:hypothetical protein